MTAIPWPLSSSPGVDAQEGAGRLINAYVEKADQGSPNPVIWRRVPGLSELTDVTEHIHCRGFIKVGSTLVMVFDTRAYTITESGGLFTAVSRGTLGGTDILTIAKNNAATPNIIAVSLTTGCLNLFTGAAPTAFADSDLPQPNSVSQLNGYFLWTTGDGRIFSSGLNAVTVSSLAFTTAQRRPGGLLRGVAFRGEFFAFGPAGCEVYRDVGASPFPLEFSTMIPRGIIGTFAVAGWEEGWTNELCWVGDDNVVYRLEGYAGVRISRHSVERAIEASAARSSIHLFVTMAAGHAFLIIKSPGEFTWVHDLTTGEWHERESFNAPDFRGSCSVRAFDRWIIGDETTGKLGEFTESHYREFGDPLVFRMQSGVPATFPARANIPRVDFDFTAGTGQAAGDDPIQTDPRAQIRWSNDGGGSWKMPVLRKIGQQGQYGERVTVLNTGIAGNGRRWEIAVSDPVHVGCKGGQMALLALAE